MNENNLNMIKVVFPDNSEREVYEGISLQELSEAAKTNINQPLWRQRLTTI